MTLNPLGQERSEHWKKMDKLKRKMNVCGYSRQSSVYKNDDG
jgi:hypothetical protein